MNTRPRPTFASGAKEFHQISTHPKLLSYPSMSRRPPRTLSRVMPWTREDVSTCTSFCSQLAARLLSRAHRAVPASGRIYPMPCSGELSFVFRSKSKLSGGPGSSLPTPSLSVILCSVLTPAATRRRPRDTTVGIRFGRSSPPLPSAARFRQVSPSLRRLTRSAVNRVIPASPAPLSDDRR